MNSLVRICLAAFTAARGGRAFGGRAAGLFDLPASMVRIAPL
jgi:hypothetical protein